MTVSEKKPRQNTGNHPDPLSEYPEARKRLEEDLRASDAFAAPEVFCTRETARALLAGPPEPSEEEVARVIYDAMPGPDVGEKPPWVERGNSFKQDEARVNAQAVQALYRSRRA